MTARTDQGTGRPASTDAARSTACILCECNCGITVELDGRSLAKIRGDKAHPASEGYTCEKAMRLDLYQNGPHRLTTPLKRQADGSYAEIDWETALDEIAAKLSEIKREHGGESIFFYGGGGQGNHLGSANSIALREALGSKYYSNALAQEKTGEMWVDGKLYGGHTKGDFEHSEVMVFIGKNPWQSHSFPRARPVLKAAASDPQRSIIVVDPRRSETAALADHHLQVLPGRDAWLVAALVATLVQEDLVDHDFLAEHTTGYDQVRQVFGKLDIAAFAEICGVPEDQIRAAARRIGTARTVTVYEDLGTQQAPRSTLVSYLNKLLWILTGNFAKPGTMFLHSSFVAIAGSSGGGKPKQRRSGAGARFRKARARAAARTMAIAASGAALALPALARQEILRPAVERGSRAMLEALVPLAGGMLSGGMGPATGGERRTPVTGARIIAGLVPCNSIADEILTDHPDRFRAMWMDSVNPAHSLPGSARFREAMRALDLTVVVDVAFTETARMADYVLPAASQYEKAEATFFNFEFPRNVFHLRKPLLEPLPGTLPEPEIYAGLIRRLGVVETDVVDRLRAAAKAGRETFGAVFMALSAARPELVKLAPYLLHESLGHDMPANERGASVLWGAAQMCAMANREAVARAGFDGPGLAPGNALFDAIMTSGSGVVFTEDTWDTVWDYVRRPDRRFTIAIDQLLDEVRGLPSARNSWTTAEFPLVLAAGERRSFTANTIFRNPDWRRRDRSGALRISEHDASALGLSTGDRARLVTAHGAAAVQVEISDMMQPGNIALPNGLGVDFPAGGTDAEPGAPVATGTSPNELTSNQWKDSFAGTPWHKHVPARLEPIG
ncbi:molybdopterin-dependent oxidoreductase [Lolliginicoccus suaedae]|uniref:molybdopterin-dependent oxidoreductase n=1 Tax=Lolliginicoccus suaedae TaxID=2605429 RepID=UPI0011ED112B|nr:molybdopterin-dependent oxidoreductase [Lolliginicoccus suaedae]